MKKFTSAILCGAIILSAAILPVFTGTVHSNEITQLLENREYYEKDDILVKVYEFDCKDGIGGISLDVNYDSENNGNNLDFYDVTSTNGYYEVHHDNSVGRLSIGIISDKINIKEEQPDTTVKIAVGFKSLNKLQASFIKFSYDVRIFADANRKTNNNYNVSDSMYIYSGSTENVDYEEYVNNIVGNELCDTDTDITTDTDIDTDTATDTDTISDTDTQTDTDTNSDIDTPTDTDTNSDTDTPADTDTNSDTDNPTDTDTNSDTDTPTHTDTNSDTDTPTHTDTNSDTDNPTHTDTNSDTDNPTDTDTNSDTDNPIIEPPKYIYGDVDFDNKITSVDALIVLRNSVKLDELTPLKTKLGDVDGDENITSADSLEILRYSVGLKSDTLTGNVM